MSSTVLSVLHINPHNSTTVTTVKYDYDSYYTGEETEARKSTESYTTNK